MGSLVVAIALNFRLRQLRYHYGEFEMNYATQLRLRHDLAARQAGRGMTLIEIMIVVAIIAMVAGGVAAVAIPRLNDASKTQAKTNCRGVRNAVKQWRVSEGDYTGCPTMTQLIEDKFLDAGQEINDPWGEPYEISCSDDEVTVTSPGPDKKLGSKDDISVPKSSEGDES